MKKMICIKHIEYKYTRSDIDLAHFYDKYGCSLLCNCRNPSVTNCASERKKTCRPYKITIEFIKKIPE